MQIILFNNVSLSMERELTLAELLVQQGYEENGFAVAVNQTFVPRSTYASVCIREGDKVDVIVPMQGG
ncbi:MAG: sulfur carrier protein ThiS [Gammaproteobacteria bacterium]|jgi:sulfur carrier protein|nr:sulfur carrier protein ThiS [Gammaproteobacteria bacterium]